jgi:hypothetical protein
LSVSSSTPVDDILADAAERSTGRKIRAIGTPDHFSQWTEFGAFADLDINIRIPTSYYDAIKGYSNISEIAQRERFNDVIIDQIEAIDLYFSS